MIDGLVVENREAVRQFLRNYPLLLDFIEKTAVNLRKFFPNEPFVLRLITDPEDGVDELVLFVQSFKDAEDVFGRLRRFDEEFWLGSLPEDPFYVTMEFL